METRPTCHVTYLTDNAEYSVKVEKFSEVDQGIYALLVGGNYGPDWNN